MKVRKYLSCLEIFFLTGSHRLFNMGHISRQATHGIMTKITTKIRTVVSVYTFYIEDHTQ